MIGAGSTVVTWFFESYRSSKPASFPPFTTGKVKLFPSVRMIPFPS